MTTLAEALLLLALDDEKGTVSMGAQMGLDFGLAGAMIAELAARERLRVDDKNKVFIDDASALDDRLLNDVMAAMSDKPGKKVDWWVHHLSHAVGGLRKRLLDGLIAQGTLERREHRILLLFHYQVFPECDERIEHDIRQQLDAVLLDGQEPDPRTYWLIQLADACEVTNAMYAHAERRAVKKRIKALKKSGKDMASGAVSRAIEAEQAAVIGAIVACTVVATSAATVSACSAAGSC